MNLRVGVPSKGRLSDQTNELMERAGLRYQRHGRGLFSSVAGLPVDFIFLRTSDIPVLCGEGAIDMGVTGSDVVAESQADVITHLELGFGRCRLALCVPEESAYQSVRDLDGCTIATSFPNMALSFAKTNDLSAHVVPVSGSVETMIALGVAQAVVDIVETGSTLAAHHLRVLEELGKFEAVLIGARATSGGQIAKRIVRRAEGAIIAFNYSLIEYNIPSHCLEEAVAITPGFKSPTISALEDKKWFAVRSLVRREEVVKVMEDLSETGATAILELPITNCRL